MLPRLGRAGCGIRRWRGPLFYQEAMPIRSRYQGGAYSPVQHHEVVAGQGRAVAGERGGGCAERRDPHHGVCRRDVVTGSVVRDRPACAHVVVQQFQSGRRQIRREPGDADVDVADVVEVVLFGSAVLGASSGAEPEYGPKNLALLAVPRTAMAV